jgi:predicted DCC family thiol-disulfide oxidoreductase YuxK
MSGTFYYDENCGLCDRSVAFLKRHDTKKNLKFLPLQCAEAAAHLPLELTESLDTAVYLTSDDPAKLYLRSDAVLHAIAVLGPCWRISAKILSLCPLSLRNYCYDQVAQRRHVCKLPTKDN